MSSQIPKIAIIGAGAAGCFAALQIVDGMFGKVSIQIFERSQKPLAKLRISGGGRCNVTHNEFDIQELASRYPRGYRELPFLFSEFQPKDTIQWFSKRGVPLKSEEDGRMFPTTDSSETIINCFLEGLDKAKIPIHYGKGLVGLYPETDSKTSFRILWEGGESEVFDVVVLATGSNRKVWTILEKIGIQIIPPIPSLFTLGISKSDITQLTGVVIPNCELRIGNKGKIQKGPILITHWGLSGPCALRLSAWEARDLFSTNYKAELFVNWIGGISVSECENSLYQMKESIPQKRLEPHVDWRLPNSFWKWILKSLEISEGKRFAELSKKEIREISVALTKMVLPMDSKGEFKEEFVTAGGVSKKEIHLPTMQTKQYPGLYLAGEILDIDGITGGFNFQHAWTSATLVARSIQKTINHLTSI